MSITQLQDLAQEINRKYSLTPKQIIELIENVETKLSIPLRIFQNRNLGIFETIVKFLHENHEFSFAQISKTLNRDNRTVWSTYHNANKKVPYKLKSKFDNETMMIPIEMKNNNNKILRYIQQKLITLRIKLRKTL